MGDMVKIIKTKEELDALGLKRWFQPEYRLYLLILRTKSPKNRRRYVKVLYKKLMRKGVILDFELVEELLRIEN